MRDQDTQTQGRTLLKSCCFFATPSTSGASGVVHRDKLFPMPRFWKDFAQASCIRRRRMECGGVRDFAVTLRDGRLCWTASYEFFEYLAGDVARSSWPRSRGSLFLPLIFAVSRGDGNGSLACRTSAAPVQLSLKFLFGNSFPNCRFTSQSENLGIKIRTIIQSVNLARVRSSVRGPTARQCGWGSSGVYRLGPVLSCLPALKVFFLTSSGSHVTNFLATFSSLGHCSLSHPFLHSLLFWDPRSILVQSFRLKQCPLPVAFGPVSFERKRLVRFKGRRLVFKWPHPQPL